MPIALAFLAFSIRTFGTLIFMALVDGLREQIIGS